MKVFTLASLVLVCAVWLASAAVPVHAQADIEVFETTDPTMSSIVLMGAGATGSISNTSMAVSAGASDSGSTPPGYMDQSLVTGVFDVTVEWSDLDPVPTEFLIGVSGAADASDTVNTPLTARGSASAETDNASANTNNAGPPNMSHTVDSNVPSGTQIIISSGGNSSGEADQAVTLEAKALVTAAQTGPPTGSASSSASSSATLQIETVTEQF